MNNNVNLFVKLSYEQFHAFCQSWRTFLVRTYLNSELHCRCDRKKETATSVLWPAVQEYFGLHIFVFGRHLGFGNCTGLGRGNISRGVGIKWRNGPRGGEGEGKIFISSAPSPTPTSRLHHNNACTAAALQSRVLFFFFLLCFYHESDSCFFHTNWSFFTSSRRTFIVSVYCCVRCASESFQSPSRSTNKLAW